MKQISVQQVVRLHEMIIAASGGSHGVRDKGGVESAVAQPQMSFGGQELYPTLAEKAAALMKKKALYYPLLRARLRAKIGRNGCANT